MNPNPPDTATNEDWSQEDQPSTLSPVSRFLAQPSPLELRPIESDDEPVESAMPRSARLRAAVEAAAQLPAVPLDAHTQPCPLKDRYALEVLVIGADDKPIADVGVELARDPNSCLAGKTGVDGWVRFESLPNQAYSLYFPGLDRGAWELAGNEPLSHPMSAGEAVFQQPEAVQPAEITYVIEQGEGVSELAMRYGFAPDTIWLAGANSGLRSTRKDKNILNPADTVVIPAKQKGSEQVQPGQRYKIRRIGLPEVLRIRFLDSAEKPRANVQYLAEFESGGIPVCREGTTTADGFLIETIPPDVESVEVFLGSGPDGENFVFPITRLDTPDTPRGVRARLLNLGYDCGPDEPELDPATIVALADFQRDNDLPVTARPDPATIQKLEEMHLS